MCRSETGMTQSGMAIPDIKNRESLMKIGKVLMENRESLMTIGKDRKQNRVGGKRSSFLPTFVFRPLTPPYVPFGIRRFLFWIPFEIRIRKTQVARLL